MNITSKGGIVHKILTATANLAGGGWTRCGVEFALADVAVTEGQANCMACVVNTTTWLWMRQGVSYVTKCCRVSDPCDRHRR